MKRLRLITPSIAQVQQRLNILALVMMVVSGGAVVTVTVINIMDWNTTILLTPGRIKADTGFAYVVHLNQMLPILRYFDDKTALGHRFRLLENNKLLAESLTGPDDIRKTGLGNFRLWGYNLFFSASDNSDPRTNGRRYALDGRVIVDSAWEGTADIGFCLTTLLFILSNPHNRAGWRARWTAIRTVATARLHQERIGIIRTHTVALGSLLGLTFFFAILFGLPPGWCPLSVLSLEPLTLWICLAILFARLMVSLDIYAREYSSGVAHNFDGVGFFCRRYHIICTAIEDIMDDWGNTILLYWWAFAA